MVIVNNQLPYLLNIRRSDNDKVNPVEKTHKIPKYNKDNNRSLDEQKKNDVKTAAVILRTKQKRKS
jgi:hypothetical protein